MDLWICLDLPCCCAAVLPCCRAAARPCCSAAMLQRYPKVQFLYIAGLRDGSVVLLGSAVLPCCRAATLSCYRAAVLRSD